MGPRSVERGKTAIKRDDNSVIALQWGRVLLNAESPVGIVHIRVETGLQWGRVLLNAESVRLLLHVLGHYRASMGPRSVERGKDWEN